MSRVVGNIKSTNFTPQQNRLNIKKNNDNCVMLKNEIDANSYLIDEAKDKIVKMRQDVNSIGVVLFNSMINFREKREIMTDISFNKIELNLIDTYPINLDYKDGIFKPIKTAHYYLNGSFQVINSTEKQKDIVFSLFDDTNKKEILNIKQTLIGGTHTIPIVDLIKLSGIASKKQHYYFRVMGDKLKIKKVCINLLRINGTMA